MCGGFKLPASSSCAALLRCCAALHSALHYLSYYLTQTELLSVGYVMGPVACRCRRCADIGGLGEPVTSCPSTIFSAESVVL
jgi:hypothetical protein